MFLLSANHAAPDGSELFVGGETVNGKGKTVILIRHQGRNAFIGECKFWPGPKKFSGAIDQPPGYTVWHDTKAAIICGPPISIALRPGLVVSPRLRGPACGWPGGT
jgi:hypothetical protein